MSKELVPWQAKKSAIVPATASTPQAITRYAKQLASRDLTQLVSAFEAGHFEMASTFVWTKAMAALRRQLTTVGMEFIGEMLQRPDIDATSDISSTVTDSEAISLAQALGMVSSTEALRLRHSHEVVRHFAGVDNPDDGDDTSMNQEEAVLCLRACVENILGHPKLGVAHDFARFRRQLETRTFTSSDSEITTLVESPYFYRKTTLSVLLALLKTSSGAQLQHVINNAAVVIELLWEDLRKPERWQTGQTYAELYAAGRKEAWQGLKRALVAVSGFDYVPETLRSDEFTRAAHEVMRAHEGMNNFYNEPALMQALASLGTTIPEPAFGTCMTATMAVSLGNFYGRSWNAQDSAGRMLDGISKERWTYYLNECLPNDQQVLYKLTQSKPTERWFDLVAKYDLKASSSQDRDVRVLLRASAERRLTQANAVATKLYMKASQQTNKT